MKEKNYRTLRAALDRLPDYSPRPTGWEEIAAALRRETEAAAAPLAERLPTYAPPTSVWNSVSRQLGTAEGAVPTVRRLRARPATHWVGIAASLALLLFLGLGWLSYDAGPRISYTYSQEPASPSVVADWDDDEDSFHRVRRAVAERDEPTLNNLGYELDELNEARAEVKAMLVAYGEDPRVIRQLAEIERERDDVYRRIIVKL